MKDLYLQLRVSQWYKNILIFIPTIFSLNLFNPELFLLTLAGFISLCLISSSYYIINDLHDINQDRFHPEKKNRPIANKRIGKPFAIFLSLIFFIASLIIAYELSMFFMGSILLLFFTSNLYTFLIRNVAILDIIFIAINFVIRAIAGIFIINVPISYWIILLVFFAALFLVSMKRLAELGEDKIEHYRPSLKKINKKVLEGLAMTSITCLYVFFSIYSIINNKPFLLLSLPMAIYISISFFNELYQNPKNVRNPEKFIFQGRTIIAIIIWFIILIDTFYLF